MQFMCMIMFRRYELGGKVIIVPTTAMDCVYFSAFDWNCDYVWTKTLAYELLMVD